MKPKTRLGSSIGENVRQHGMVNITSLRAGLEHVVGAGRALHNDIGILRGGSLTANLHTIGPTLEQMSREDKYNTDQMGAAFKTWKDP